MTTLLHYLGITNASGPWYLWWSGFVGDLAIFAGVGMFLRHRNCHQHGCWRLGRHPVGDGTYVVCRRHHPAMGPGHRATALAIHKHHRDGR